MSSRQIQLNPLLKPATWEDVRDKRDALEVSPIATPYGTFDADQKSITRINNTLQAFDSMNLPNGQIGWKLEDNSGRVPLTKTQLTEVRDLIVLRGLQLHLASDGLADGQTTLGELDDLSNWGL